MDLIQERSAGVRRAVQVMMARREVSVRPEAKREG